MTGPNWYLDDAPFQELITRLMPAEILERSSPLLEEMGQSAAGELAALAELADANPPRLRRFDRSGERIESVEHHPAYDSLRRGSYGFGILTRFYGAARAEWGGWPSLVKFALGYLFAQAEQGLYCPICLTDGTATLLERYAPAALRERYLPGLTTNRMDQLAEGAMFLTEKAGGSDVGATETQARQQADGSWRISGQKWFCSNAGAQVMMVLARPAGAEAGTRGLGLFVVPRQRVDGTLNGIHLEALKDKLGTRSMATGEIACDQAHGDLLGQSGVGFSQMTDMLNLSRIYNAVASVALIRRALREASAYAGQREAFGRPIAEYPMVRQALVRTAVSLAGGLELTFATVALYDRVHYQPDASDEQQQLLRLLTPLAKYWTAVEAVQASNRMLEVFGGNGYIETFPMARLYRDAQVLPIWEGTTNILVLEAFRAALKGSAEPLMRTITDQLESCDEVPGQALRAALGRLAQAIETVAELPANEQSGCLRQLTDRMVELFIGARLQAVADRSDRARHLAAQFLTTRVFPVDREQALDQVPAGGRDEVFEAICSP